MALIRKIRGTRVAALLAAFTLGGVSRELWRAQRPDRVAPASGLAFEGEKTRTLAPGQALRLATFNIQSGKGLDGVRNISRTADELRRDYDLVAINEARGNDWSTNQVRELAESLGMSWAYAPNERRWWTFTFGNGMLANLAVSHWWAVPLPGTRARGKRGMMFTEFEWGGATMKVIATHIDNRSDRERQLELVFRLFTQLEPPVALVGDFNTLPSHPLFAELLERGDVAHAPDLDTNHFRDWILVRGAAVESWRHHPLGASDHPLLEATLVPPPVAGNPAQTPPGQ